MKSKHIIVLVILILGLAPQVVDAINTGVELSFGTESGHYRFNRDPYSETVQDAVIDSQGRILQAFFIVDDSGSENVYWPAVIRLNSDGRPDLSFGFLSIWMESSVDATPEQPIAITVDSSDRPILGWTYEFTQGTYTNRDGWIRRLTSSGSTDVGTVWAFDLGINVSPNYDRLDHLKDIMVMSDGRVVAVGEGQYNGTDWDFIIGVYKESSKGNLVLDDTFDTDGRQSVAFDLSGSSSYDGGSTVTVDGTGNIVVAGTSHSSSGTLVSVCRLLSTTGSLDTSFNSTGKATFSYTPTFDAALTSRSIDIANLSDGVVIAANLISNNTDYRIGALKVLTNGTIDVNFGDGLLGAEGWLYLNPTYPGLPFDDTSSYVSGVAVDYDRIVYSATISDPLDSNQSTGIALVTNLSGQAMTSFYSGGYDYYSFEPRGEDTQTGFSGVLIPGSEMALYAEGRAVFFGSMRGLTSNTARSDTDIMVTQIYTSGWIFSDTFESGDTSSWDEVVGGS